MVSYFVGPLTLSMDKDTKETSYLKKFLKEPKRRQNRNNEDDDDYDNHDNDCGEEDENNEVENNEVEININIVIDTIREHEKVESLYDFLKIRTTRNMFFVFLKLFEKYKIRNWFGMTKQNLYQIWEKYLEVNGQKINYDFWKQSKKLDLLHYDIELFKEVLNNEYNFVISNFEQIIVNDFFDISEYLIVISNLPNFEGMKSQILDLVFPLFLQNYSKTDTYWGSGCDRQLFSLLLSIDYKYTTYMMENINDAYIKFLQKNDVTYTTQTIHNKVYDIYVNIFKNINIKDLHIFKYFFTNESVLTALVTKHDIHNELIFRYVKENNTDYVEILLKSFVGNLVNTKSDRGSLKFDALHYAEFYENDRMSELLKLHSNIDEHDTVYGEFIRTGVDASFTKSDTNNIIMKCRYNSDDSLELLQSNDTYSVMLYGKKVSNFRHMCASYEYFTLSSQLKKVYVVYFDYNGRTNHITTDHPDRDITELIHNNLYYYVKDGKIHFLQFDKCEFDMIWQNRNDYLIFDNMNKRLDKNGEFYKEYYTIRDESFDALGMINLGNNIWSYKNSSFCIRNGSTVIGGRLVNFDLQYKLISADFNNLQLNCQIDWASRKITHINSKIKDLQTVRLLWKDNRFVVVSTNINLDEIV